MTTSVKKSKRKWIVALALVSSVSFATFCLWFFGVTFNEEDLLFRGKPESVWIDDLVRGRNDAQWNNFGEEGVAVLTRGLERANRPRDHFYSRVYHCLPNAIQRRLPNPKWDVACLKRIVIIATLNSLGSKSKSAATAVSHALETDPVVCLVAIEFFIMGERPLLEELPPKGKKHLLPYILQSMTNSAGSGEDRKSAAIALRFYPEEKKIVIPILTSALLDVENHVQIFAATSLWHIDPEAAEKANTLAVMIRLAKSSNGEIASMALPLVAQFKSQRERSVETLIQCVDSRNSLVSQTAIRCLEAEAEAYRAYSNNVIPVLEKAAVAPGDIGTSARSALKKWKPSTLPSLIDL